MDEKRLEKDQEIKIELETTPENDIIIVNKCPPPTTTKITSNNHNSGSPSSSSSSATSSPTSISIPAQNNTKNVQKKPSNPDVGAKLVNSPIKEEKEETPTSNVEANNNLLNLNLAETNLNDVQNVKLMLLNLQTMVFLLSLDEILFSDISIKNYNHYQKN